MALNYVTVTGTFEDGSGNPLPQTGQAAYCLFTPSTAVYASGVPLITPAQPIQAPIINGVLSQRLLATDNSGLTFGGLTGFFYWTVSLVIAGQASPAWSFFLPHLPSPVDLSALANTAAGGGGGGFTNPMTTLGDLIYENAVPAAARLAGDTSNTRKFLREQSVVGVAQAPAWDTIQAGDLPAGTGSQAWQFFPETYGAKGDGKVIGDAVLASNTTLTSASAGFTSADTGKRIMIHGALGTTSGPLITTITFVNATTVTLGSAAGVTGSGYPAVYGTDDTAAINAAVTAAGTYALANSYFAEIVFGAHVYILASGPTQTGNGSTTPTFNAQIPLPYPAANGTSRKLIIALTGAGDAGYAQYWMSLVPNLAGTCLVSMLTHGNTPDPTFGQQSVIGGPTGPAGFTSNQGTAFANVKVAISNMSVWCSLYTNLKAFDFSYISEARAQQCAAHIFAPTGVNTNAVQPYLSAISASAFTNSIGIGWEFPVNQNNDDSVVDDVTAEGYELAFRVYDHLTAGRMAAIYSDVALFVQRGGGIGHLVSIANFSAEVYNGGLLTNGSGGQTCAIDIGWSAECGSVAYDISDTGNYLRGEFRFQDPADAGRGITVNGGGGLKIRNDQLGPGAWSGAPAVPLTTVAQQNTSWRDAAVSIKGGTVTVVAVDGATLATATGTTVIVPAGKNITLTYSSAPTWAWTLL